MRGEILVEGLSTAIRRARVALKPKEARQFFDKRGNLMVKMGNGDNEPSYPLIRSFDSNHEEERWQMMDPEQAAKASGLGLLPEHASWSRSFNKGLHGE